MQLAAASSGARACAAPRGLDQAELHVLERRARASPGRRTSRSSLRRDARLRRARRVSAKRSPRRAMVTSSAVSIWRRFSSSAPHRLARRWLSTGVKRDFDGLQAARRSRSSPRREWRARAVMVDVDEPADEPRRGREIDDAVVRGAAGELGRRPSSRRPPPARAARVPTMPRLMRCACAFELRLQPLQARELSLRAACRRAGPPPACRGARL